MARTRRKTMEEELAPAAPADETEAPPPPETVLPYSIDQWNGLDHFNCLIGACPRDYMTLEEMLEHQALDHNPAPPPEPAFISNLVDQAGRPIRR